MYVLKSRREIEMMRRAGQLAWQVLEKMRHAAVPGATTGELDELARIELEQAGAVSGSKNYPTYEPGKGFPGYTCISVNAEIVHGVPGKRALKDGDVVSLDMALSLNGYYADTATTVGIGRIAPLQQKLLDVTEKTLKLALQHIRPGKRWSEIARLMQHYVESNGFAVVREFVGHGVGRSMHEDPKVPNFVTGESLRGDFRMLPGMTLAIEPMVVAGKRHVKDPEDGWTMVTVDGKPAAHFEHTVAVTEGGVDVLTDGRAPSWGL
jgi:methionyl aminopeptidase